MITYLVPLLACGLLLLCIFLISCMAEYYSQNKSNIVQVGLENERRPLYDCGLFNKEQTREFSRRLCRSKSEIDMYGSTRRKDQFQNIHENPDENIQQPR